MLKSQRILVFGGGGVILVFLLVLMGQVENNEKAKEAVDPAVVTNIAGLGKAITDVDIWIQRSEDQLRRTEELNNQLAQAIVSLQSRLEEQSKQIATIDSRIGIAEERVLAAAQLAANASLQPGIPTNLFPQNQCVITGAEGVPPEYMERLNSEAGGLTGLPVAGGFTPANSEAQAVANIPGLPAPPPPLPSNLAVPGAPASRTPSVASSGAAGAEAPAAAGKTATGITRGVIGPPATGGLSGIEEGQAEDQRPSVDEYVPAGSFVRGILLSSLDAPTGGQASGNPHPILIRLTDYARLPNKFKSRVQDCFVLGSAFGNLSSERAMMRLENLSCVLKDRTVLDTNVAGFVVGEDGKTGLRGTLVSKQGAAIGNAMLAGFISGVGSAFSASQVSTTDSTTGFNSSILTGDVLGFALGQGASNAAEKVADYYIKMAESVFPIIEIASGREVDIVFTSGFYLNQSASGGMDLFGSDNRIKGPMVPLVDQRKIKESLRGLTENKEMAGLVEVPLE